MTVRPDKIMFLVAGAVTGHIDHPDFHAAPCSANCGRYVPVHRQVPEGLPVVCDKCGGWLRDAHGPH